MAGPERWVYPYARWRAQYGEPGEGWTEADLEQAFKADWDARQDQEGR